MPRRYAAAIAVALALGAAPAMSTQTDPALDGLFARLRTATDPSQVAALTTTIWETWTLAGDKGLDALMARGLREMSVRDLDAAIATFGELIERAPEFAEAWNKRATVHWMRGDHDASVADIRRTVALEPRHFGAWSGLGMIFEERDQFDQAIRAYEEALRHNPHSAGLKAHIEELKLELAKRKT